MNPSFSAGSESSYRAALKQFTNEEILRCKEVYGILPGAPDGMICMEGMNSFPINFLNPPSNRGLTSRSSSPINGS